MKLALFAALVALGFVVTFFVIRVRNGSPLTTVAALKSASVSNNGKDFAIDGWLIDTGSGRFLLSDYTSTEYMGQMADLAEKTMPSTSHAALATMIAQGPYLWLTPTQADWKVGDRLHVVGVYDAEGNVLHVREVGTPQ